MATGTWEHLPTCKWTGEGQLDITGFPEDMPMCLQFYLTSIRPEKWPRAMRLIQQGEGHCFANEIGILFPLDYESSSSEEDQPSRGPIPEDEVEFFAGYFPKDRVKKSVFLRVVEKCLKERNKTFQPLDGETEFLEYVRRETKTKRAIEHDLPGPGSTGIQRTTSVDSLESQKTAPKQTSIVHQFLGTLDLATDIKQEDTRFTDWATNPDTKQLVRRYRLRQKLDTGRLNSLEVKHEIAKRQLESQRHIVQHLQKEVTRLTKEQETVKKVLLDDKKKSEELTEANESMESIINDLLDQKTKLTNKLAMVEGEEQVPQKQALDEEAGETVQSTQVESEILHTADDIEQLTTLSPGIDTHKEVADDKEKKEPEPPAVYDHGTKSDSIEDQTRTETIPEQTFSFKEKADYGSTDDSNMIRVAKICNKLDRGEYFWQSQSSIEEEYRKTLVTAIITDDILLEREVLKSLGDLYLEKGKTKLDVSELSKAAAMYNKALTRCGASEGKQTLLHRIRYTEKVEEDIKQELLRRTKQKKRQAIMRKREHARWNQERLRQELELRKLGFDITEDHFSHTLKSAQTTDPAVPGQQYHREEPPQKFTGVKRKQGKQTGDGREEQTCNVTKLYRDHLEKGESSLARADLDSAEQHFAAALKTVHVRDLTAQQYQREMEPLCKLGEVYSKRGQQTTDGGDFVKAAALYNAAIARSKDQVINGNIVAAIIEVEKSFLKCILDIHRDKKQDDTGKHKKQLKEMRDQIKLEMETIDQQLDPYVHDEDDPRVKEIEAKRAQAVRQLFENIVQQRKQFISLLVEECIGLMGPPPCKYALIGLGSQATGLVTPYSDLEFAILVEEESEKCLVYFRNLTHYLHLKVVNLGETIIPALGIKSLNDFYSENPLDNWYYDSVTPRGFTFDASIPRASKTPLGRGRTMNEPPSELICTPECMVSILQKDVTLYLKEGNHLSTILRNPCLIAGDQDLIGKYMDITVKVLQVEGNRMAQQLARETLREDNRSYSDQETITARLISVKKQLYRFPVVAVDCLALSSNIIPTTVWKTIEEMENQQVISPNNAHHLTVLTSISAELRLRTYIANGGQRENQSTLASIETMQELSQQSNDEVQTTGVKNEKQLFRYYHTAVPLKSVLSQWSGKKLSLSLLCDLYDSSPRVQGITYSELCKYRLAISCYNESLKKDASTTSEKMALLRNLGDACLSVGDYQKAISYTEHALSMYTSIHGENTTDPNIAMSLNKMGQALSDMGDHKKAIHYFELSLQIRKSIHGQATAHAEIATSLTNLGSALLSLGDYTKAIRYFQEALEMIRAIYGLSAAHPEIARLLNHLGEVWGHLADNQKAISYHECALKMYRRIYGQNTTHPHIAMALSSMGRAWLHSGDPRKAIVYHEQALQMYRSIFAPDTAHHHIARLLNHLGQAWAELDDHSKAISYHEQALQMERRIYGQSTAHPNIAISLNNLGSAWHNLGDYRKAIGYYEQSLQMMQSIYGPSTVHPDIAMSLNNLGSAWHTLGDYRKAISYFEKALHLHTCIYGHTTAHPHITISLNNMGTTWLHLGNYRKAINYYEQALQMLKRMYGQTTAHPDIARLLNNLGKAWFHLGDRKKALSYHDEALNLYRSTYGWPTVYPDIAKAIFDVKSAWEEH
ncbi:uncharacterized protein LOC144887206 [Branchiostoma floridae x Branchiostoma japonicum]